MRRVVEIPRSPSGYGFRLKNERPCLIDHVLTGSSAEKSGVRAGDILLKVNGVNVINVTHEEVASLIWRCHEKLFIEVESQESKFSQCIICPLESSHQNSHCMTSSKHKAYSRTTSVFVYAGCVLVPTDFKSCTEELSILRRKTNSVINKIHVRAISICLVDICLGVLQVLLHDTYTAKYPASCLYSAGHVDFDEKFLYIVTRNKTKGNTNTMKVSGNLGENASVQSMNCHVFRTLPAKFLSHPGHITIAKTFGIICSYDRLTGECCNFPSSTTCALSHLHTMLEDPGIHSTMNTGDLRSVSRRSSEIYHSSADISSTEFHMNSNSIAPSFQDPNYHANQPKRSRNSLPEPINPNLISKFLKVTSSLSSRFVSSKNSLETVKTNCDEQPPKISCFSSTIENEDTENIEPPNNPSTASSNPISWAEDFDNLLNDPVACNEFRQPKNECSMRENASVQSMNCHVFRTLPAKFLSHPGHITIAKTFGIICSYDRLTGECCNFPSSTTCALSHLHTMLEDPGIHSTMNTGDLRSVSRRSSEIYHSFSSVCHGKFLYFKFLITEFSSENLDFLLSVRTWRHVFETGNVKKKANEIFDKFLVPDAPQAVNIDHLAIKSASSCLSHPHVDMFLEAENQVYTLMKTDSFPRFLESSNYLSILNNFKVNKSSRKSTVRNQSKIFKNKSNVSIDRMSSKISTTTNQLRKDEDGLISSQVKSCTHGSSQVNKSKSVDMHRSDNTATPSAEIKDNLNKELNPKSFKSNLMRLKSMNMISRGSRMANSPCSVLSESSKQNSFAIK
uniref:Putative regulator of G protein signaling n=2 Tax=Schistosoma mansoni TaxID=6183 RepID=A0A5K4EL91_SCHMA